MNTDWDDTMEKVRCVCVRVCVCVCVCVVICRRVCVWPLVSPYRATKVGTLSTAINHRSAV
jgi:hypothetical protein